MGYVDKLASLYDGLAGPPGIPWDGLVAKGHGIAEGGFDPEYQQLLLEESFKFFGVIGTLNADFREKYSTIETSQARSAVTRLIALVNQMGADIWDAVKHGNISATIDLPASIAGDVFATFAATAANGAYLHFDGVMESALLGGKITVEEVQAHAQSVMQMFQTFVDLDKNGHLDHFKAAQPTSGLGMTWAVAAVAIVAVLGVCYLLYVWQIAAPVQNKVFEWCDKLTTKADASDADLRACVAAATSMTEHGNGSLGNFLGDALKPLGVVIAIGAAVYIGSLILPSMLARRATS